MNKILIIGPAWVGDMVMAQSLFILLNQQHPKAVIDVLAPEWSLPLLARMPEVHQAMIMPIPHGKLALRERYRIGKALRQNHYHQAIVLPNSFKSALIPYFAKIPVRTGWRGEMRYGILNDLRQLDTSRYPLMIERFLALGLPPEANLPKEYLLPTLHISQALQQQALQNQQITISHRPILALCPGAEFGPAKKWPEKYFAEVANKKLTAGWDVWIMGSPNDAATADTIMQLTENRCTNLTGKTTLETAVDLLSLTSAVVSNDSGLMHIAAALHKPLIALYGPTSSAFTPPLHTAAKVLKTSLSCQPCFQRTCPLQHHRCMQELLPEKVLAELP